MVSLLLFMIITWDIIHNFSFALNVWLTLSLALIIVFEGWVTETYITPAIERLLDKIVASCHKFISSAYIALRVFCLLMRLSSSSVTKIANKWALRRIDVIENRSSLKRWSARKNVRRSTNIDK